MNLLGIGSGVVAVVATLVALVDVFGGGVVA